MKYDPNESMFPIIGEPVQISIVRGEEKQAASGRDMLVLHTTVADGQPGAGWESRFYALSFHIGDIMRAVGMDATGPRDVDALTFRGKMASVIFKQEPWTNDAGVEKVSTKIDRWLPLSEAGASPVSEPEPPEDDGATSAPPPDDDDIPF